MRIQPIPSDQPPEATSEISDADRRTGAVLVWMAAIALLANCLLTSPPAFSEKHHADTSLLKTVVSAQALGGKWPTVRGVEIRNLCFYAGAALLLLWAGGRLVVSARRSRLTVDDLFDLRTRATGPYFWWGLMLMVSVVTSAFAHAPDICKGQVIIRFLHLAWWWPLAAFLVDRHVPALMWALLASVAATAGVGLWYHLVRVMPEMPQARLQYPIGNELWFGACLLPAIFVAIGLAAGKAIDVVRGRRGAADAASPKARQRGGATLGLVAALVSLALVGIALILTRSRSAGVGLAAGVLVLIFVSVPKRARLIVVLIGLVLAIVGSVHVQGLRSGGVMGQRAHSIRARLNRAWPYALTLFFQKPVGGHGEGCYAMLAGQFARQDQLDDPAISAREAQYWRDHADNEGLELLADIGIAGTLGFFAAIAVTLFFAVKRCDRLRETRRAPAQRCLVVALTAALVGMVFEECSNTALRQPGFPPIFLTVWAGLWVLARGERRMPEPVSDAERIGVGVRRSGGVAALACAGVLAYFSVMDWRASRARFETETQINEGAPRLAIAPADFAGRYALDPFQKVSARMLAIRARANTFARELAESSEPATDESLATAREAFARLNQLNYAAPRFVGLSRLAWELSLNLANAYRQREDQRSSQGYYESYLAWLERNRADEPFMVELVERLWRQKPNATVVDRLLWLRSLLRKGPMDARFLALMQRFGQVPGSVDVIEGLLGVARTDFAQTVGRWTDALSPETFRVAALAADWTGRPLEAVKLVEKADRMYSEAGPRLFEAHAAAIHERVRYQFHADPTGSTDDLLEHLARAHRIMTGRGDASTLLPRELGWTRLRVLLAAGRRADAERQLDSLPTDAATPKSTRLARAYAGLAEEFSRLHRHLEPAVQWAKQAAALDPALADAQYVLIGLYLQTNDDDAALTAGRRFVELASDKEEAYGRLQRAERRWPSKAIWDALRGMFPDYPPAPNRMREAEVSEDADGSRRPDPPDRIDE